MTYRWQGHFAGDPAAYRPQQEVRQWKQRCPIRLSEIRLREEGVPDSVLQEMGKRVDREMEEIIRFALDSPPPDREEGIRHVYRDRSVAGRPG